jgi:soluble lytic murein transglycosylase-like protein
MLLLAGGLHAGERVVLTTGFEMHADRHEVDGDVVRVYSASGVSELPKMLVAEYRVEEYTPPEAPAAPKAEPAGATAVTPTPKTVDARELIRAIVAKHKLPKELEPLVASVIRQESGFHANALSPKGAIGFMQLMPDTARQLGADPHDPAQNIEAGTEYLTALLTKYEHNDDQVLRALAAYNAGPGAVDKYNGVPPYRETRDYVRRVVKSYLNEQKNAGE